MRAKVKVPDVKRTKPWKWDNAVLLSILRWYVKKDHMRSKFYLFQKPGSRNILSLRDWEYKEICKTVFKSTTIAPSIDVYFGKVKDMIFVDAVELQKSREAKLVTYVESGCYGKDIRESFIDSLILARRVFDR